MQVRDLPGLLFILEGVMIMDLKPCPFCGDFVQVTRKSGDWGYTAPSVSIRCERCGCGFSADAERWEQGKGHFSVQVEATEQVINLWNTRNLNQSQPANDV